jgi:hypothetical protein
VKLDAKITEFAQECDAMRKKVIEKFSEGGKCEIVQGKDGIKSYKFEDEEGFNSEYEQLMSEEVNIPVGKVNLSSLKNAKLTPVDVISLNELINQDK